MTSRKCLDCRYRVTVGGWSLYCTHPDQEETSRLRDTSLDTCDIGGFEEHGMDE